jgi:hypothetical protein
LVVETNVVFANIARRQDEAKKQVEKLGVLVDGKWNAKPGSSPAETAAFNAALSTYSGLNKTFGAGSPIRILATAITGAAGGNVTGSVSSLFQGAAVNVLQSLTVTAVKKLADSLGHTDPVTKAFTPNTKSETLRAALQGLVGCAGAVATTGGNCGSGALGASASVALNLLLDAIDKPERVDTNNDGIPDSYSLEDQQLRTQLITTLTGALAGVLGGNAQVASVAGTIETENNKIVGTDGSTNVATPCITDGRKCTDKEWKAKWNKYFKTTEGVRWLAAYGDLETVIKCLENSNAIGCAASQAKLLNLGVEFASKGINFDSKADQARQKAIREIYAERAKAGQTVSPDLSFSLYLASQLGVSAADIGAIGNLPAAQISNNLLPWLKTATKDPRAIAVSAVAFVAVLAYVKLNPLTPPVKYDFTTGLVTPVSVPTNTGNNPPPSGPEDPDERTRQLATAAANGTLATITNPDSTPFKESDRGRRFNVGIDDDGNATYQDGGNPVQYTLDSQGRRVPPVFYRTRASNGGMFVPPITTVTTNSPRITPNNPLGLGPDFLALDARSQNAINAIARFGDAVIIGNGVAPGPQLPQDAAVTGRPAPPVLDLTRPVGGSATQNAAAAADIAYLDSIGAINIQVNQAQLNVTGTTQAAVCRSGICRPDVQATLPDGRRIIIEYDTRTSTRGVPHAIRRQSNDPNAIIILRRVD